jgi:hypothetical protein
MLYVADVAHALFGEVFHRRPPPSASLGGLGF